MLKFTAAGEVSLRICAGGSDTVRFDVRTPGSVFSEHQQEIIFDAFRQADGSTHRKYGGTGLASPFRAIWHACSGATSA